MRFGALGPLEVMADSGPPIGLGGLRQRALLAVLLIHVNQAVSVDQIADALWSDAVPQNPERAIQTYASRLRALIGESHLQSAPGGYRLRLSAEDFDVSRFDGMTAEARMAADHDDPEKASKLLGDALSLWRGRAYDDLAYETFVQQEARRLEELRLAAREDRIDAELNRGRHTEVIVELETLAAENALRERLQGQLMVALYRAGRQADALRVYSRTRERLIEELGIEPGPALRQLELRILNQDDDLISHETIRTGSPTPSTIVGRRDPAEPLGYLVVGETAVPLVRAVTTIGRDPGRAIVIDDPEASRHHAEVRRIGDDFVLVDLGSLNGTKVNNVDVAESVLFDGDSIEIGRATIRFRLTRTN